MIGHEMIFSALVIVTLMMVLLSVPSIFITLSRSARQYKKYTALRLLTKMEDIPKNSLGEWNAVKSDVGYISLITEEIERMGALRPALFNSEIAAILIVVLMIYPGYETDVMVLMCVLLALCVVAMIYGYVNMKRFGEEYLNTVRKMADDGHDSNDNMYV